MKLILCFLLLSGVVNSADLLELNFTGKSKKSSTTEARKDVIESAVEENSFNYIKEIIGESKTEKNKTLIKNKIIEEHLKYIPIIKVKSTQRTEDGIEVTVGMKLSVDNLKKMLLREGLLYEVEGPPKVLPMIVVVDRVNSQSYSWWSSSNTRDNFLKELSQDLNENLKKELRLRGFYGLNPDVKNFRHSLPASLSVQTPRSEDYMLIGQYFDSAIVVKGSVKILSQSQLRDNYSIQVRLQAVQASNGRAIGDVIRKYSTETGSFQIEVNKKLREVNESIAKDLSVQVLDAWQKGTFGASLIKLTLNGNLSYPQLNSLKKMILTNVNEIKGLRERLLQDGKYTFEVDSAASPKELAESFKRKKFPKFKVEVDDIESDELALDVKSW